MSAPTPPEPVGDWAAWSAAMHARLHPARPADPTPDELQRYAALRGVFIAEAQAEVVTLKADLAACRQLNVDLQRDTLRVFNELRAERDALRRLAFEVVFAFDSEELIRLGQETYIALARIYDEAPDEWLDEAERKRQTRDGGGR